MGIKSDKEIYQLIEDRLRKVGKAQTCTELMEDSAIREEAVSEYGPDVQTATNKLSDAVGLMWRRGLLVRYPAPKTSTSFARYAYAWHETTEQEPAPLPPPVKLKSKTLVGVVEHDDCVEIEFDKFIIYVKPK